MAQPFPAVKNTFLDKLLNRIDRVGQDDLQAYLQRLNNEKGFFETIFNTLQEGIVVVDSQGRILYLNHAINALLGIDPAKAMGTPIAHYLKELDWPKILAEGRVVNRDLEVFYPQPRYLNFYLVPLEGKDAALMGFALIFHDLTARRAQAREAIESEKLNAVTLLAAGVAHELGNPLNSLNIHLQLLERDLRKRPREDGEPDEDLLESVRIARSEVGRLDTIINQFLGAVRPAHSVRAMVSINTIVRESLAFLQPEIKDRDVIVQEELGELTQAWMKLTARSRARGLSEADLRAALADETADLLGHVLLFANAQGVDLNAAIERKWMFKPQA